MNLSTWTKLLPNLSGSGFAPKHRVSDVPRRSFKTQISAIHYQAKRNHLMPTNTLRLHRVFRAAPEKVYRAFLDADAMAKWLPPHGFTGKVHQLDARVGGTHKMSFTNFTTGQSHSFGGTYLELVPH